MNKYLRYTLRAFVFLIALMLVAMLAVYLYVSSHKKEIIEQVTGEISGKINGNVTIGNIDLSFFSHFPQVSVILQKVLVTDSLYSEHKHPFLQVEEAHAILNVRKLASHKPPLNGITLIGGSIYLFTDTSGYSNSYLFKPKKDPKSIAESTKGENELESVTLKNIKITVDDKLKNKFHDFMVYSLKGRVSEKGSRLRFHIKNDLLVNSLAFNVARGSFVKGKKVLGDYYLWYDKDAKQLQFDSIDLNIGGHDFNFAAGRFDLQGPSPQFAVRIHSKKVMYPFARSLLTAKISKALSIVSVDKPLDADVEMSGPLKGGDPLIKVFWKAKNCKLNTPFLNFDKASFTGFYTDEVVSGAARKDPNSKIEIKNFSASWEGFPITSHQINIVNLQTPTLLCDLKSDFPLSTLSELMNSSTIIFDKGLGHINISYKGPLEKNNNTNSFVNGYFTLSNGRMHYAPRDVYLEGVSGKMIFKSSDVFVENLQCDVLGNKVQMQGYAKDLLTFIGTNPSKAQINWSIYSPSLNLASFAFLLSQQKHKTVDRAAGSKLQRTSQQIDKVIEQGALKVNLRAGKVYYKKFEGANVVADLSLLQDRYILHKVSLQHAGGTMDLSGVLTTAAANYHNAQLNVSMANVDVSKVFYAFNNFGQDGITAENLRGNLTADVSVNLALNDDGKVYKESVEGIVDFSLKNGALINFEPVKKMQVFLFKKRDFDNITFAELKDRLEIKNEEVKINRMEIQSSVLSMFVEGIFSMKGTTDMSIQVPLSNLKKRGEDYVPENLALGKKAGASVYLRGTPGKDGNIKFKLDLLNKFRKDKTADD